MTVPLIVLALRDLCRISRVSPSIARFVGLHGETNRFEHFLAPVFDNGAEKVSVAECSVLRRKKRSEEGSPSEYLLMALSIAAAGAGWWSARRSYVKARQRGA